MVTRAHLALGLFDLLDQPWRSVRVEPLAGVVHLVRALEGIDDAPARPRVPFPDGAADENYVLRRVAARVFEVLLLNATIVGNEARERSIGDVVLRWWQRREDRFDFFRHEEVGQRSRFGCERHM